MQSELLQTLIFFLTGGFLVFLAITITRDNFTNRVNRATGALLFCAGLGPLAMALGDIVVTQGPDGAANLTESAVYNLYLVWEFFFPALVAFSWVFPVDRLRRFKHPRFRYLIVLPQLFHLALLTLYFRIVSLLNYLVESSEGEGLIGTILQPVGWLFSRLLLAVAWVHTNEVLLFGLINICYVLVAIYFLEVGKRYLTNPRLLTQTRFVLWGTRVGLGLYVLSFLCWTIWDSPIAHPAGDYLLIAAILSGGGFFAYAIVRHQFLNVQLVFRQSMIYTATSVVLVGTYIILGMRSKDILTPLFGERAEIVSYVFILLILILFQPISLWVDNIIRGMFMRTRTDYRGIIERFSRQVISIFEPALLRQTIEETLKTAVLVDRVYFILYDDSVGEYAILKSDDYGKRTVLDRDDLMLRGINLLDTPTRYTSLSDYEEGSRLAEILEELGVRVILPMKDAQHLLGFLALTSKAAGYRYTAEDFNLLGVLSNQMVTALTNARLYADSLERLRLEEEVNMARQIQLDLLPSNPPQLRTSRICATSTPSRTVGGDFYDFIPLKDKQRMGIVIADASGKGMPAALMVAQIQAIIRSEVNNGNPIPVVMKNMNTQVALSTSSEKYVTLFYAELELDTGMLHFANGGHNYPILVRANGEMTLLEAGGPVIGAFPYIEYDSASVQLYKDDILFFFTDGLSEAMDAEGREYGEDRIREFVINRRASDPETIMEDILSDVKLHDPTNPPQDDTTIITIKMTDGTGDEQTSR